jgi:TonB-linked outer membrane protein, SusC/RagA family/TonB-dependent outer membrane receptor, SusC/RagA subfamily, signature region
MSKSLISLFACAAFMSGGGASVYAQQSVTDTRQVSVCTGTVIDSAGDPVIGASVIVKGTSNGNATDIDGNFRIPNVRNGSVLVVSCVGYKQAEVQWNGEPLSVTLSDNTEILDEVVVVGYGVQKKVNLTGSVSNVNMENADSRPVTTTAQLLANASPGLQVMQNNGMPGSEGFSFNIRGQGTLNNSSPLVLVDGIEMGLDNVNANQIASISVLKDAASCAIYGNRGANGVILVTTKNGSDGKVSLTYDGTFSLNTPSKIIHTIADYPLYMRLMNESSTNIGGNILFQDNVIQQWEDAKRDPNGISASGYPNYVAYPNTDWWDHIYNKNWMQKHSLSVSGKEKRTGYQLNFTFFDNPGIMDKSGFKRYSGRVNIYSDITDWLRIGTRTNGYVMNAEVNGLGGFFGSLATSKMIPCTYPMYDGKYGAPENSADDPQSHNPLWDYQTVDGFSKRTGIMSAWYAQVKFLKHFTYQFDFNYQLHQTEKKTAGVSVGKYSFSMDDWSTGADDPSTLYTSMDYGRTERTKIDNILNYNQSFGSHDVSAMLGYEEEIYNYRTSYAQKLGLTDDKINDLNAGISPYSISGYGTKFTSRSWFGRVNYAYAGKYLLEANFRRDGSSRFAPDCRWGTFPSFSAGWRMTEESFFPVTEWINNLKLRASWGKLGNNSIGNYDWQSIYTTAQYATNSTLNSGIAITNIANPLLSWETSEVTNIGLDYGFFNNRLNGSIEWYNKITSGILYTPDMSMTMGTAGAPRQNIAEVTNRGLELEIGWSDRIGKVNYSVRGSFAYNKNWVSKYKGELKRGWNADHTEYTTNIGDVSTGSTTRVIEGHMINEWYLPNVYKGSGSYFHSDGKVNINGGPRDGMIRTPDDMKWVQAMVDAGYQFQPNNNIGKQGLWYGEYIYADSNGDGIYGNSYDSEFQGCSTMPKYNFGLYMSADWNNFDLSMNWGGAAGYKLYYYSTGRNASTTVYGYAIPDAIAYDHYFFDPENPSDPRTNLTSANPRLAYLSSTPSSASSALHLEDASFIKLRNLTFGYTVPQNISHRFFVEKLRVYFSAENLFTITGFSGMDPEMRTTEGYATMRQYAFGVNLSF